jgi:hypothetical protein
VRVPREESKPARKTAAGRLPVDGVGVKSVETTYDSAWASPTAEPSRNSVLHVSVAKVSEG